MRKLLGLVVALRRVDRAGGGACLAGGRAAACLGRAGGRRRASPIYRVKLQQIEVKLVGDFFRACGAAGVGRSTWVWGLGCPRRPLIHLTQDLVRATCRGLGCGSKTVLLPATWRAGMTAPDRVLHNLASLYHPLGRPWAPGHES